MAWLDDLEAKRLAEHKTYQERRRLVECLTSARINATGAYERLVNADIWANDEQAPKVEALYKQAEQLQKQIIALLQEVQGE